MSYYSTSFYIPRIELETTESKIIDYFLNIGYITRIDFTPVHKGKYKSAFVYFSWLTQKGMEISKIIETGKPYYFYPYTYNSLYWMLLPVKNPIQNTMMNTTQIVEKCHSLEKIVKEQAETIVDLQNKIADINLCVYNLVNGLFCHSTQMNVLDEYLYDLCPGNKNIISNKLDTSVWWRYPTTRQGDYCERRIRYLEEEVKFLKNNIETTNYNEEVYFIPDDDDEELDEKLRQMKIYPEKNVMTNVIQEEDDDTVYINIYDEISSIHSSMPDLNDIYSDDYENNKEDIDIISVSSLSSV